MNKKALKNFVKWKKQLEQNFEAEF